MWPFLLCFDRVVLLLHRVAANVSAQVCVLTRFLSASLQRQWTLFPAAVTGKGRHHHQHIKKNTTIYLWMCWVFIAARRLSLVAASRSYSLVSVRGLLVAAASLVAEHKP